MSPRFKPLSEFVSVHSHHNLGLFSTGAQTAFSYEWKEKKSVRLKLGAVLRGDHRGETSKARRRATPEEMTMTTIPESLNSPGSGKAVFMEFGPPSQQMSPPSMSHGHYPMHCLHSAGHTQHESYSPASSFPRSLGYPYVNSVGSHSTSPYLSTVQTYQNSSALAQTRLEDTGKSAAASAFFFSFASIFEEEESPLERGLSALARRAKLRGGGKQSSQMLELGLVIIYCVTL